DRHRLGRLGLLRRRCPRQLGRRLLARHAGDHRVDRDGAGRRPARSSAQPTAPSRFGWPPAYERAGGIRHTPLVGVLLPALEVLSGRFFSLLSGFVYLRGVFATGSPVDPVGNLVDAALGLLWADLVF